MVGESVAQAARPRIQAAEPLADEADPPQRSERPLEPVAYVQNIEADDANGRQLLASRRDPPRRPGGDE